jgi:hypothetical protein
MLKVVIPGFGSVKLEYPVSDFTGKAVRLGIDVCLEEGCSRDALTSADILVTSANDALDLVLNPKRLMATLRF